MGESARRKTLVEDVRKKVGEHAAAAVGELQGLQAQLHLEHKALAREMEVFRRDVEIAKAAPTELRRDVRAFQGAMEMQSERLENISARVLALTTQINVLNDQKLLTLLQELEDTLVRFACMSLWERLRWLVLGRIPFSRLGRAVDAGTELATYAGIARQPDAAAWRRTH